jgi:hypothetical protein
MPIIGTNVFLGGTLVGQSYLGNERVEYSQFQGDEYAFRNDPFSASLVLALPLSYFPSLGMSSVTSDVHKQINTAGSSNYTISTLGTAGNTYASSSIVKFPTDGYTQSYVTKVNGALTTANNTEFSISNGAFTVEGWVNLTDTSAPASATFFHKYVGGNPSASETLYDYQSGNTRFALDFGVSGECFAQAAATFTAGNWYHFAFQRTSLAAGADVSLYFNGTRVLFQSCNNTINTTSTIPQFIGVNNGNNTINAFQDYRIYKGVAKYSGTTITPPQSIVYKLF